jgi:hypothetical protein
MKRFFFWLAAAAVVCGNQVDCKAELVAFWGLNDNGLPGGGFGYLADPSVFPIVDEIGTLGASLSVGGGITDEISVNGNGDTVFLWLQSFSGTIENSADPEPISGGSLAIQGGTLVEEVASNNGAYVQFEFSMTGYENLVVSYATRGTSTGFETHTWSWSTDGETFTDFQTISGRREGTFTTQTLNPVPELNEAATAFLRVTVDGATSANGNNRLDNIQFNADATMPGEGATVLGGSVVHGGWTGSIGSAVDSGKSLAKEGVGLGELTFDQLINTARGLNGVLFEIQDLGDSVALTAADFQFQVSPQGAFDQVANPPAGWDPAPAPSSLTVTPGSPDQVLIQWPDNAIENRWLRITILANANTGLAAPEVYYVGHLLGETTGASSGFYTVSFSDVTPIRVQAGQTVGSESIADIDKNGTVAFADVSAMRPNIGSQLTNISIP